MEFHHRSSKIQWINDSTCPSINLDPILWIVSVSVIVITGMPFTYHTHGCHCAIVIAWMDVYCQFLARRLAARSVGHCHWMGQLIQAHTTILCPSYSDSNRSNWLQSLGLIRHQILMIDCQWYDWQNYKILNSFDYVIQFFFLGIDRIMSKLYINQICDLY